MSNPTSPATAILNNIVGKSVLTTASTSDVIKLARTVNYLLSQVRIAKKDAEEAGQSHIVEHLARVTASAEEILTSEGK